jgi:hypothetical protein
LIMPPWLYLLGVLMTLMMGSRPCFILGQSYPHGVWFYFPVLFVLKSPLGFLGLLALAAAVWLIARRTRNAPAFGLIPASEALHWRALWVSLGVMLCACLLSRLSIGIRHFSVPMIILILLLAPLPALLERLLGSTPRTARALQALAAALVVSCLFTAVRAFPYYTPYLSPLSLGRPAYALVNGSNVDWNQSLPEVRTFAARRGLTDVPVDARGLTDPALTVPQARLWDCQTPQEADRGRWVVVSASVILDGHNCAWLLRHPNEALAGGAMYAFHLPMDIPPAGRPGGPPLPSEMRQFAGGPANLDMRAMFRELSSQPDKIPGVIEKLRVDSRSGARGPSDPGVEPFRRCAAAGNQPATTPRHGALEAVSSRHPDACPQAAQCSPPPFVASSPHGAGLARDERSLVESVGLRSCGLSQRSRSPGCGPSESCSQLFFGLNASLTCLLMSL